MSGENGLKIHNKDDVRMAAGLLALEEVDRVLDRLEGLELKVRLDTFEDQLNRNMEMMNSSVDDPLGLLRSESPVSQGNDNFFTCCMIAGLIGVAFGALGTYLILMM